MSANSVLSIYSKYKLILCLALPFVNDKIEQKQALSEINKLLSLLPPRLLNLFSEERIGDNCAEIMEIALDLGRPMEIRFIDQRSVILEGQVISKDDLGVICEALPALHLWRKNRIGLDGTLHRISALRNPQGEIIGLTMRVANPIEGGVSLFEDILQAGKSVLLLGLPGSGKTSKLREIARFCSVEMGRRVVIVDNSAEIGGWGDIAHPCIGKARRLFVREGVPQYQTMLEAVENHTPQIIIIDEISTSQEAQAARSIAERGVTLIATAHGKNLSSLIENPALSALIGSPQVVTLSDEEADKRSSKKSVVERTRALPFEVVIEIASFSQIRVHSDASLSVDEILQGRSFSLLETRRDRLQALPTTFNIYAPSCSQSDLKIAACQLNIKMLPVDSLEEANLALAESEHLQRNPKLAQLTKILQVPLLEIADSSISSIKQTLQSLSSQKKAILPDDTFEWEVGLKEAQNAIASLKENEQKTIELSPRKESVRALQNKLIQSEGFKSELIGEGIHRRIRISR